MSRVPRWMVAAAFGLAVATIGCAREPLIENVRRDSPSTPEPIVADDSVAPAFDTTIERRLIDRLELDNFLRDRDIRVQATDGVVHITGEVWTPLERERAGELLRHVAGVVDVVNELDIRPPR